jgi:hypothetical protein
MTIVFKRIKEEIQNLPPLQLPNMNLPFILETDASNDFWETILLQKHSNKDEICAYASGTFNPSESKYPSSHKDILVVKKGIKWFSLFLKSVKFTVKIYIKHMKGMLHNHWLLEQGNSQVLRCALWLDGFDFDIIYKYGSENYLVNMLSREGACKDLKMFSYKGSRSNTSSSTYPITICSNCFVHLCWECFSQFLHNLIPKLQQKILHRWDNSWVGRTIYNYTWKQVNNERIIFGHTHPPHQIIHYSYIFDPDLRWTDYFRVHQFAKRYKNISIIMYCEDILSSFRI